MKKILLIGLILLNITGCWDIQEEISSGYKYIEEVNNKNSKYILFEGANSLKEQENNSIPCTILKYIVTKNYILVKIKFHYKKNFVVGFNESKHLIEGGIYYYIIDTKKHIRYGEYNKINFNKEMKKLNMNF